MQIIISGVFCCIRLKKDAKLRLPFNRQTLGHEIRHVHVWAHEVGVVAVIVAIDHQLFGKKVRISVDLSFFILVN